MKKGFNLKTKVMIGCVIFTALLTIAIGFCGYYQYNQDISQKYRDYAGTIVNLAEVSFKENNMPQIIREKVMGESYDRVRHDLNAIKEHADVAYIFAIYFEDLKDPQSMCYVINGARKAELAGQREEDIYSYMGEPCGKDDFDVDMRLAYLESMASGDTDLQYYENVTSEYGHMLTCYKVLYDTDGEAVAVISVDENVDDIQANMRSYMIRMIVIALGFMVFFALLLIGYVGRFVTGPVIRIAQSANGFVRLLEQNVEPEEIVYEDPKVRSQDEIGTLSADVREMAQSVKDYMQNLSQITKEKERIGAELDLATKIQADMLPNIFPAFPERDDFDIYASMTPAKEVGGDFYDFFLIDDDHLAIVMADVSGKGVPAALFMMMSKILINNVTMMAGPEASPAEVLTSVNDIICQNNEEEMFVTVWLGIMTISSGQVVAANAGHEYPILKKADGRFELFKDKHGFVIGGMEGMKYKEYEFTVEKGGALFLYTDGVAEATNGNQELFGIERTLDALNQNEETGQDDPKDMLCCVEKAVDAFVGEAPQFDDLTMLAVKRK